jgi:hypothetical protein
MSEIISSAMVTLDYGPYLLLNEVLHCTND